MIGDGERRARLGWRQALAPSARAARVEDVADAVVGLHATDAATVYLSACERLAAAERAVAVEAVRLAGWLGEVRVTPRFRTAVERELVARR